MREAHVSRMEYSVETLRGAEQFVQRERNARNRELSVNSSALEEATQDVHYELSDGQWHRYTRIRDIARAHGVYVRVLIDNSCIAISEGGDWKSKWVCMPGEHTPLEAPSERNE